jgi:uncharacterized protein YndB with AHSA1/START domain
VQAICLDEKIHIDKPVADVFSAWSTPDSLADWFAPMAIVKPTVELDFRKGGHYSIRMLLPDDQVFTTAGVFKKIVENEKIVMTWRCDAFPDTATLVTTTFLPDQTGTVVRVRHEKFEFDDTCANHKHGWQLCLAKLKELLETGEKK